MQGVTNELARGLWPELNNAELPLVLISERFTRRAGAFAPSDNMIVLARKYFECHGGHAITETIMHELCHWAAYHKGTWKAGQPPHGLGWQKEMTKIGLDPKEIHCEGGW